MIHILFNIDECYIPRCKAVMRSILAHTKSDVMFHIVGVIGFDFEANMKFYPSPDLKIIKHKTKINYISMASVYRLFAPFILKVDKVIYLDCDLIVLDNIEKLWQYEPRFIAGVQDPMYRKHAQRNDLKNVYINSGVMVMNLKNLRRLNWLERIKETQNGNYNLSLLDQDIINIALGELVEHLPLEWNVYSKIYPETTCDMIKARDNPSIIHWCGRCKPWNSDVWQADKWRQYV